MEDFLLDLGNDQLGFEAGNSSQLLLTPERVRDIAQRRATTSGPGLDRSYMPTSQELEHLGDMLELAIGRGQLIDFGHWPNDMIRHASQRAGRMYTEGALAHPFRTPYVFMHSWDDEKNPRPELRVKATNAYLINPFPDSGDGICIDFEAVELEGFDVPKYGNFLGVGNRISFNANESMRDKCANLHVIPFAMRFYSVRKDPPFDQMDWSARVMDLAASNVLEPLMVALSILNTRGVESQTVTVKDKLNNARVKRGKPIIPPYRRVDSSGYVTAIQSRHERNKKTPTGSHASPIPHMRIGHWRHYQTGEKSFVRDTLVNATDDMREAFVSHRSHYTVKE
jgi:hypothetical protein